MSNANDFTSLMPSLGSAANGIFGFFGGGATAGSGSAPDGTQNGSTGVDQGSATDSFLNTLIGVANATVPVWAPAVAKQQQKNQVANPVFAGIGTAPGLTSGAGPAKPGPQSPGGIPQIGGNFLSTPAGMAVLVGGIALLVFVVLK
jgi:hypothetical protein